LANAALQKWRSRSLRPRAETPRRGPAHLRRSGWDSACWPG